MPRPRMPETAPNAARREAVRKAAANHYARMQELTKLEQAAWKERKQVGEEQSPYTPSELQELAHIKASIAELQARTGAFSNQLLERLTREATEDPGRAALLERFRKMQGQRVDLPAF